jgi:hypothetical protein
MFENSMLRKVLKHKRDDVTRGRRNLLSVDPRGLYSSENVIKLMKARRMRWAGHLARMN